MAHTAACIFFAVADRTSFEGGLPANGVMPRSIPLSQCLEDASRFDNCTWYMYDRSAFDMDAPYLRSMLWSIVILSTVGFGDIVAFTTLSEATKRTVRSYYEAKWKLNGSAVGDLELFEHLPRSLRRAVSSQLYAPDLRRCALFVEDRGPRTASNNGDAALFMQQLALIVTLKLTMGAMRDPTVADAAPVPISVLKQHDYFGEESLADIPKVKSKLEKRGARVVDPTKTFARWWHRTIGFILVYNFYVIIFRLAFLPYPEAATMAWLTGIDYILDVLLFADVYLKFGHLGFTEFSEPVLDPEAIKRHYRSSGRFWQDCLGMLPIYYRGDTFEIQERFLHGNAVLLSVFDLVKFFLIFVSTAHYIGSIYYLIGWVQLESGLVTTSWVSVDLVLKQNPNNPAVHYIRSMYWCLSAFTVDCFGDILARNFLESFYELFTCVLGWVFIGQVIGRINALMITLDKARKQRNDRVEDFQQYAKQRALPDRLRQRAMKGLSIKAACQLELGLHSTFRDLPGTLRALVAGEMYNGLLQPLPEFAALSLAQLEVVARALVLEIYLPGDIICESNRVGTRLYILKRGCAERVAPRTGIVYGALTDGALFASTELRWKRHEKRLRAIQLFHVAWGHVQEDLRSIRVVDGAARRVTRRRSSICVPPSYNETRSAQLKEIARRHSIQSDPTNMQSKFQLSPSELALENSPYSIWPTPVVRGVRFDQNSRFRDIWAAFMLAVTFYYLVMIPFQIGFLDGILNEADNQTVVIVWYAFEYLIADAACVVDFVLHRNYFVYTTRGGELVTDPERIARHYWRYGWYLVDVLSMLPVEILMFVFVVGLRQAGYAPPPATTSEWPLGFAPMGGLLNWHTFAFLRINRRVRGLTAGTCYLVRLAVDFLLGTHWLSCLFYGVSYLAYDDGEQSWLTTPDMLVFGSGVRNLADIRKVPILQSYLRTYHFSIGAITTVCYGDIIPMNAQETLVTMAVIFISVVIFSMLSGGFYKYFDMELGRRAEYEEKVAQVGHFLRFHRFPTDTWRQMQVYFALSWRESRGRHERDLLRGLPPSVRQDLAQHVHSSLLKNVALITRCDPTFARAIIAALQHESFVRNDVIIQRGDMERSLYIVESGIVLISAVRRRKPPAADGAVDVEEEDDEPPPGKDEASMVSVNEWVRRKSKKSDPAVFKKRQKSLVALMSPTGAVTDINDLTEREEKIYKGPFDYFGERSLLFGTPRNATCVALCVTSLFVLTSKRFEAILDEFPHERSNSVSAWVMTRTPAKVTTDQD
uniref:Cyclic nucleotide-binding domain-containing protein n=1 Tax=Phytophthora ramorum TaxID=164328 RepID=H3HB00_PHYRM